MSTVTTPFSQRPYSIRTRIKTLWTGGGVPPCAIVRDHIPLEQGLRRIGRLWYTEYCWVRDHIPLEQGLRRSHHFHRHYQIHVRDHIPLEQGLRLFFIRH